MNDGIARRGQQRLQPVVWVFLFAIGFALIVGVLFLGPTSQRFDCARNNGAGSCEMVSGYVFSGTQVARFPEANIASVELLDSRSNGARNAAPFTSVMLVLADGTRYPVASYPLRSDASQAATRLRSYLADSHAKAFEFGGHPLVEAVLLFGALPVVLVVLILGLARWMKSRRT